MIPVFLITYFGMLLVLGVPMFFCVAGTCTLMPLLYGSNVAVTFSGIASDFADALIGNNTGITIMLFMLAGDVMSRGKLTERIFNIFAYPLGKRRGFMPLLTVITCMFYGAISGSSPATAAAVGAMCYPMLVAMGYDSAFSAAIIVCAGTLGGIIPPSIALTGVSVLSGGLDLVALFKMGAIIGVGAGIIVGIFAYIYCLVKENGDREYINNWVDGLRSRGFKNVFFDSIWAVLTPVLILGTIFSGVADTAQAAGLSLVYGAIVSVCIYKTMTVKELFYTLMESSKKAMPVLTVIGMMTMLSNAMNAVGVSQAMMDAITSTNLSGTAFMCLIMVIMMLGGTIGAGSSVTIMTPLVYPLMIATGADPFVGGTAMALMQAIGNATPPIGMALFAILAISGADVKKTSKMVLLITIFMFLWALFCVSFPGLFTPFIPADAYIPPI